MKVGPILENHHGLEDIIIKIPEICRSVRQQEHERRLISV
jgi:hypothetical protein